MVVVAGGVGVRDGLMNRAIFSEGSKAAAWDAESLWDAGQEPVPRGRERHFSSSRQKLD